MVRVALMLFAPCASALEPTGLLQATVGVQSQLSAGSDKVASVKRMEKEWQAAAQKGTRVDDSVLNTVYTSMQDILSETESVRRDILNSIAISEGQISRANAVMTQQHADLLASTDNGGWSKTCSKLSAHADCRATENSDCTDRDNECADKDTVQEHCTADNPLCECAGMAASHGNMKMCLERAKAWYHNYHATADAIPAPAPRGYFVGALGASETKANITKETEECAEGDQTCATRKSICDGAQNHAQQQFCTFNSLCDTWCSNYESEYAAAVSVFDAEVATLLTADGSSMLTNLDVCFAVKKVICFVNVIANKGYKSDDQATDRGTTYDLDVDAGYSASYQQSPSDVSGSGYDYEFCLNYEPQCDNLIIETPTAPPQSDCNTFACKMTVAQYGLPTSTSWMSAYYQSTGPACSHNISFYLDEQPEPNGTSC